MNPQYECTDFPDFVPVRAHMLLKGVYGDYPHNNNGSKLDRVVLDDAVWQRRWIQTDAQLDS